jgi:hypothetical protein
MHEEIQNLINLKEGQFFCLHFDIHYNVQRRFIKCKEIITCQCFFKWEKNKISLRHKSGLLLYGQQVKRFLFLFWNFFLYKWTAFFTSVLATPNMPNSNSKWARGEFLLKTNCKSSFFVYFKKLLDAAT